MGRYIGNFLLKELEEYVPTLVNKPDNFDQFWSGEKSRLTTLDPTVTVKSREYPVPTIDVRHITFESFDGTPLTGMLVKPKSVKECPVIISFPGYTGSCGRPMDYLKWTSLGVAVFAFDIRGQGTSPDFAQYTNGSSIPGWMLHSIQDHESYYYTNVYRDIMMQLNWIRSGLSPVNPTKLAVVGSSQGGGLALVAAGLDKNIDFVIADFPFIAHFERALEVATTGPYMEIVNYFKLTDPQHKTYDQVMRTLGYIDSVHFCEYITCPALMAIGLEDTTTPPVTAFAAYNHLGSADKSIEVYPQFIHEINPFHEEHKLEFIMKNIMK